MLGVKSNCTIHHTHTHTESRDRMCTVDEVRDVTHDTKLFRLQLSKGSYFKVPVGHHISVRAKLGGKYWWAG